MDFVRRWSEKTEIGAGRFIEWLGVSGQQVLRLARALRQGQRTQRLGSPRFLAGGVGEEGHRRFPSEESAGRLPAADVHDAGSGRGGGQSVQRLARAGAGRSVGEVEGQAVEERDGLRSSRLRAHEHWHIDVSYINISGTFYYLCSVLDGYSRFIVHWELRESMTEAEIEIMLQRAREKYPEAKPRIISDNGPQFLAKDFKEFIRIAGMTHVRTSPYYPQSNGKLERWHKSLKSECIRPGTPLSQEDARTADPAVRRSLQQRAPAQRHRLRDAHGHAGGPAEGDPRGAGSQAGRGAPEAATAPPAGGIAKRRQGAYNDFAG